MKQKAVKEKKIKKSEYTETGGMDYSVYYMKPIEYIFYLLLAAGVLFALGFIFYRSVPIAAVLMLLAFLYPPIRTKQIISARRQRLNVQFKDMLYSLSSALSAGNSVERSMSLVLEDMERQYVNPQTHIVQELQLITSKLSLNANIEDLLADLSDRSGIEDIRTFSNIFEISKRTGGNLIQIVRQTSEIIGQKIETKTEMETILAEKKMEQKVLTATPILLLFFLTQSTGDFMAPLFSTIPGRVVCTISLAMVVVGYFWGKKLSDINV